MTTYAYLKKQPEDENTLSEQIKHFDFTQVAESFIDEEDAFIEFERLLSVLKEHDNLIIYSLTIMDFCKKDMK